MVSQNLVILIPEQGSDYGSGLFARRQLILPYVNDSAANFYQTKIIKQLATRLSP